jgi:prolyl 4-hydroxylase
VAAKSKKGDALLFYSLKLDGSSDPAAMHTGCPVIKGVKWTATKWIHTKPFRPTELVGRTVSRCRSFSFMNRFAYLFVTTELRAHHVPKGDALSRLCLRTTLEGDQPRESWSLFRSQGTIPIPAAPLPEICADNHSECDGWAAAGECDRNPKFMKGDDSSLGACRLSCKECEVCGPKDRACMSRNRLQAGFLPLDVD